MRNAAYVFTFSEKVRSSVINDYEIPPAKVVTAFAGVNIDRFPGPIHRQDRGLTTILFAGNDYARKGLGMLLEAFRSGANGISDRGTRRYRRSGCPITTPRKSPR